MSDELLMVLLPILVPYVTAGIKKLWVLVMRSGPAWMGPVRGMLGGMIVAAVAKATGIPLPSDLTQLSDQTVLSVLTSGAVLGALGAWIKDATDGVKTAHGPDSLAGKLIRAVAGERT